jgi:3-dehydroquinate synthase
MSDLRPVAVSEERLLRLVPKGAVATAAANQPAPAQSEAPEGAYVQRFSVTYEFPVFFTRGLFSAGSPVFLQTLRRLEPNRRHRFVVFIDDQVSEAWPALRSQIETYARQHSDALELVAPVIEIPGGEAAKNDMSLVVSLQRQLLDLGMDRHSFVVGVGGGALLDLIGYVAASTHRGVRHVRVPTTVLAQNDSGVGVKNGVNAFGVKNFVGAFAPPFAVLNDLDFIDTLSRRDKIAGMAEAVKVALIRDAAFFEWLEANSAALVSCEPHAMTHMIRHCAELHMRHIATSGDPFEYGSARPLDYGHWSAHKLEAMTRHDLRHGEAVAIGLVLDARYAVLRGMLAHGVEERICRLLHKLGFALWHPVLEARESGGSLKILDGLREFREHLGGELTVTLLEGIGRGVEVHEIDVSLMGKAVAWLKYRDEPR